MQKIVDEVQCAQWVFPDVALYISNPLNSFDRLDQTIDHTVLIRPKRYSNGKSATWTELILNQVAHDRHCN
jgi:hypothetical protein